MQGKSWSTILSRGQTDKQTNGHTNGKTNIRTDNFGSTKEPTTLLLAIHADEVGLFFTPHGEGSE